MSRLGLVALLLTACCSTQFTKEDLGRSYCGYLARCAAAQGTDIEVDECVAEFVEKTPDPPSWEQAEVCANDLEMHTDPQCPGAQPVWSCRGML